MMDLDFQGQVLTRKQLVSTKRLCRCNPAEAFLFDTTTLITKFKVAKAVQHYPTLGV